MKEFKDLKGLFDDLRTLPVSTQIASLLGAFVLLILNALNPLESFAKLPTFAQILILVMLLAILVFVGIDPSAEAAIRDVLLTLKKLISI
mgnify:CR=1 FL=1